MPLAQHKQPHLTISNRYTRERKEEGPVLPMHSSSFLLPRITVGYGQVWLFVLCNWHNPLVPVPLMPSDRGIDILLDVIWTPNVYGRHTYPIKNDIQR